MSPALDLHDSGTVTKKPQRILALDIGTKLGMCMIIEGAIVETLTWHVKAKPTEDLPDHERWRRLHKMLIDKCDMYSITDLSFELVNQATIRGSRQSALYWGAVAVAQLAAAQRGLAIHPVPVQAVKKIMTGKGNATKEQVIAAAHTKTTLRIDDDNSADAVGVGLATLAKLKGEIDADWANGKGGKRKGGRGRVPGEEVRPQKGKLRGATEGHVAKPRRARGKSDGNAGAKGPAAGAVLRPVGAPADADVGDRVGPVTAS